MEGLANVAIENLMHTKLVAYQIHTTIQKFKNSGGARRRRRRRPPTASRLKGPRKRFCLQVIKKRPRKPDVADVHEWCSAATDLDL
ncbi:hypothetical protein EVAR_6848_1 [Eumeta japonica]|uniref:Uncharacterized protein n=1 Tax=Eumeta variegata TaxID=151549 RepID=A0A4C1U7R1_EUMVA|nr:hypothetical protein EVAR_6848_1 [Eumeta japonica]